MIRRDFTRLVSTIARKAVIWTHEGLWMGTEEMNEAVPPETAERFCKEMRGLLDQLESIAELTPFERTLLIRAIAPGGLIPSDNMGLRMGEISNAGALTRRGLLQEIRHETIPGPPSGPGPWTITDAGRISLGENPAVKD